jgi:4-hydroxy-tetrahydrodipicolinate reductase
MTEIVVGGALGRMGRAVLEAALRERDFAVVGLLEAPGHPALGEKVTVGDRKLVVSSELPGVPGAVIIEFTAPEASVERAREAATGRNPLVIGTTGFTPEQLRGLEHVARKIPVVLSANMSVGVNILWDLVRKAVRAAGGEADVEIIEVHHNRKKDAPSGTALAIADAVAEARGRKPRRDLRHGREGVSALRRAGEVGVHAVRAGDVVGDHTVMIALPGERLELVHRAHGRDVFAAGALRAARFAAKAQPGFYRMADVLGIEKGER